MPLDCYRKLYIADARPRKNALTNGAIGGGSESSANYLHSEVKPLSTTTSILFFSLFIVDFCIFVFGGVRCYVPFKTFLTGRFELFTK
jgi:hypothetical protein